MPGALTGSGFGLEPVRPSEQSLATRALSGTIRQMAQGNTKSMWQGLVGASDFAKRHPIQTGSLAALYMLGKKRGVNMRGGKLNVPLGEGGKLSIGRHNYRSPVPGEDQDTPYSGIKFTKRF
tara:strand:+ start:153 stop:518 length:366 start_codon:yes stop_codon:yes gene_type:complete